MKLQSFALQSKSSSKPKPSKNFAEDSSSQPQNNPEFVSEFDPSQTLISAPKKSIIIPPKENEWRPHKKMKNLELPPLQSANQPLDFELENSHVIAANAGNVSDASMAYGLNVRPSNGKSDDSVVNGGSTSSIDAIMIRQFKSDLEMLPEEQGFDEYEDIPVDGFGAALLAGYGWKEGNAIGKNAREDVKVVEYKRRTAKEGLGFMADHPPAPKIDGSNINAKEKSDVLVVGKEVRVVRGGKLGLKGTVVEVLDGGLVVLDKEKGGRDTFMVDEVAGLGSVEEEKCLRRLKELKIRDSGDDRRSDIKKVKDDNQSVKRENKRSREGVSEKIKVEGVKREEKSGNVKRVNWLMSHIRVRIISKELKGGKLYLRKGEVVDVIRPGICDILMDDGREIVRGVDQDILETALPKRGGHVVVLFGKHKSVYGKLVEKDSKKETGVVQNADTLEMFNVKLEEIAEYLGDPSNLGY